MTVLPDRYREVSVTDVDVPLEAEPLRALLHFPAGLPAHAVRGRPPRRPGGAGRGLRRGPGPACSATVARRRACSPGRTRRSTCVAAPTSTPGVPSALAPRRRPTCPGARCVVVEGRYGHVSFVLDRRRVRLHVLDVVAAVPGEAARPGASGCSTPPTTCPACSSCRTSSSWPTSLPPRSRRRTTCCRAVAAACRCRARRCLPRRGAAAARTGRCSAAPGRGHPRRASTGRPVTQVDTCPRALAARRSTLADGEVLLTKCCLLEEHVEVRRPHGRRAVGRVVRPPAGGARAGRGAVGA